MNFPPVSKNKLTAIRKLLQKKYRREEQKFLIEGAHLVAEAVDTGVIIDSLLLTAASAEKHSGASWFRKLHKAAVPILEISERDLASIADTESSPGIIGIVSMPEFSREDFFNAIPATCLLVALDGVADPGNLGTIIRTCDWFGVDGVLLGQGTVDLYNQKVIRSTQGSLFHLPVFTDVNLPDVLRFLRERGFAVIGTSLRNAVSVANVQLPPRSVMIFGNEAEGVAPEVARFANTLVTIPGYGKAESLNVSVACGVTLGLIKIK